MDNSLDAFTIFKNNLNSPKKSKNGNLSFYGEVIVKIEGHEFKDLTKITLKVQGFESGNITIEETHNLRRGMQYFGFSLNYQDYNLTHEGHLVILDSEQDYQVIIRQV